MARCPFARQTPFNFNSKLDRMPNGPKAAFLHTNGGGASLVGWFNQQYASGVGRVGCTFQVYKDGRIDQFVDTDQIIYAQYSASRWAVSIETEDDGRPSTPWTAAQVQAIVRLLRWLHQEHGIPLRLMRSATDSGIGYHEQFSVYNASGHRCPGPVREAQLRNQIIPALNKPVVLPTAPAKVPSRTTTAVVTAAAAAGVVVSGAAAHSVPTTTSKPVAKPTVTPTVKPTPAPTKTTVVVPTPTPTVSKPAPKPTTKPTAKPTAKPVTPTKKVPSAPATYVVHAGDTLDVIAEKHSLTVEQIVRFNGLSNPNLIRVGQVLRLRPPVVKAHASVIAKVGSTGESVKYVQRWLGLRVTGVYGISTRDAVKKYQKMRGLPVTGVVDQATWRAMHR